MIAALCCLVLSVPGLSETPENVSSSAATKPSVAASNAMHRYGQAPQQFFERWQPAGRGSHPVLVLVHGGCWLDAYGLDRFRFVAAAVQPVAGAPDALKARDVRALPPRVPRADVPVLQGTEDRSVPGKQARVRAAGAPGVPSPGRIHVEHIAGVGHVDPIHRGTAGFRRLRGLLHEMSTRSPAYWPDQSPEQLPEPSLERTQP